MSILFETNNLRIETEDSQIPWLKIFTKNPYKEMSEVPQELKIEIYLLLDTIEKEMLIYYKPDKINIASFGNYLPHVHWHIMARFKNDNYYPEPMWGKKQRAITIDLPSFETFSTQLIKKLREALKQN